MSKLSTNYPLGGDASRDSILQSFDYDESRVDAVCEAFDEIAERNDSLATLDVHTASALLPAGEPRGRDFDYDGWLQEALEVAASTWA